MSEYLFVIANIALAGTVCFVCLCRQNVSTKDVLARVRLGYSVLGACFAAVATCTLYGERPGWAHIAASVGTLALLFSGSHRWKGKPPPDVRSDLMPLGRPSPLARWLHIFRR